MCMKMYTEIVERTKDLINRDNKEYIIVFIKHVEQTIE